MANFRSLLGWTAAAGCAVALIGASIWGSRRDEPPLDARPASLAAQEPAACSACDAARRFQVWEGYSPAFNDARREFALLADRSVGVDVTLLEHIASLAMGETTYPGLDGRDEASALRVLALDALALRAGMPESDDTVTSRCIEVAVALAYNGDRSLRLAAASAAWTLMSTRRSPRDRAGDSALNAMVRDLANDEDRFVRVLAYAASPRS